MTRGEKSSKEKKMNFIHKEKGKEKNSVLNYQTKKNSFVSLFKSKTCFLKLFIYLLLLAIRNKNTSHVISTSK